MLEHDVNCWKNRIHRILLSKATNPDNVGVIIANLDNFFLNMSKEEIEYMMERVFNQLDLMPSSSAFDLDEVNDTLDSHIISKSSMRIVSDDDLIQSELDDCFNYQTLPNCKKLAKAERKLLKAQEKASKNVELRHFCVKTLIQNFQVA